MASKTTQSRLNGPEVIDVGPDGRILDDDTDTSQLEDDQNRLLDDIIGEFGSGDEEISYSASVTRIPKNFQRGQKEPWLFECDASDIIGIRTRLRDAYHGGQFRIRVYKITNRGKKLHRQMDYFIEPPDNPNTPTGDSKYDALSQMMREQQQKIMEMADRLSNPAVPVIPQSDPWTQMERMSVIMKNLRGDNPPPANNNFGMKEGMELFTKGMELAENMRSDGGDTWISVIKEMAKNLPVAELLENLTKARQQPPMQRRQLAGPQFQQNPVQHQAPPIQNGNVPAGSPAANGEILEHNMRYLIIRAQRNSDPGLYAEWLLDNADQALIRQMANDPNVIQQLSVIFPRLNEPNICSWFVELVQAVKEILANASETEDNGAGIEPHSEMQTGQNDGTAGIGAQHPGWGGGDQDHPENHAIPGETRTP